MDGRFRRIVPPDTSLERYTLDARPRVRYSHAWEQIAMFFFHGTVSGAFDTTGAFVARSTGGCGLTVKLHKAGLE